MRRKSDFVTNSSSVSFVLECHVCGKVSKLSENVRQFLRSKFPTEEVSKEVEYVSCWGEVTGAIPVDNDYGYEPSEDGEYSLSILNTTDWNPTEGDVQDVTAITFHAKSAAMHERHHPVLLDKLLFILDQICTNETNGELFFVQHPSQFEGGGLDGGDPMGPYAWSSDILKCETKTGRIVVKNGKVRSYVKWIKCKEV